jgi:prohibitin 1
MYKLLFAAPLALALLSATGCAVVRQGEVGVKRTLGKLAEEHSDAGVVFYNPLVSRVLKVPTRTVNLEVALNLPSEEGLNVRSEISILYSIQPDMAPLILEDIGPDYETVVILSTFRSAAADVCARFTAKDMYTAGRSAIEVAIRDTMMGIVGPRGFEIEAVLLKSIELPSGLARAVEDKLEAEQAAQQMKFVLERERLEAERKRIEAQGIADAQGIVSQNLSRDLLSWQSIEAFRSLAESENAKIIITDGDSPMLVNLADAEIP